MVQGVQPALLISRIKSVTIQKKPWNISRRFEFDSFVVIYAIICRKENCRLSYIEETKRMLTSVKKRNEAA